MATKQGTSGPDILIGTDLADSLSGLGGNDQIFAHKGNDTLSGGEGDDLVDGGEGDDTIQDSGGNDTLLGGAGADRITFYNPGGGTNVDAGEGDDLVSYEGGLVAVLQGGAGTDTLKTRMATMTEFSVYNEFERYDGEFRIAGTAAGDHLDFSSLTAANPTRDAGGRVIGITVEAGAGADEVTGTNARDVLNGGEGDDVLRGGEGDDVLNGGQGSDSLYGGDGNDSITDATQNGTNSAYGGRGDDRIEVNSGVAGGKVDGGEDNDTILINGGAAMAVLGGSGKDTIQLYNAGIGPSRHRVDAGEGDDTVSLDSTGAMDFQGGEGTDTLLLRGATLDRLDASMGFEWLKIDSYGGVTMKGTDGGNVVDFGHLALVEGSHGARINLGKGDDLVIGTALADTLFGQEGNDTLEGGTGDDTIDGGVDYPEGGGIAPGQDFASYEHALSGVTVDLSMQGRAQDTLGAGRDTLQNIEGVIGSAFADTLKGSVNADVLVGGAGNDTLSGGKGADLLDGGSGADTYLYAAYEEMSPVGTAIAASERIVLDAEDRIDLSAFGAGAVHATYREGYTVLVVGAGKLTGQIVIEGQWTFNEVAPGVLTRGEPYRPVISGTAANDRLYGTSSGEEIRGGDGRDTIWGLDGDDRLLGEAGNDTLDGGTGADTMVGGDGNDTYNVDDVGDVVIERDTEGTDQVLSWVGSYTLTDGVENLILLGDSSFNGTGNGQANRLIGNGLDNTLSGEGGHDKLEGNGGRDTLLGGAGNDSLFGGTGDDLMAGGEGNDTYYVEDAGDVVSETTAAGLDSGGVDLVKASVNFALGAYVEALTLTGTAGLTGTGNALANSITGNDGANQILGLDGNDTLAGGRGADTLEGGAGDDTFVGLDAGDWLDGGEGTDTLSLAKVNSRSWVYLDGTDERGVAHDNAYAATGSVLVSIENVTGSAVGSDALWGDAGANWLVGLGGNDRLYGKGGGDRLEGGDGADTLSGGAGADDLIGGAGADWFVFDVAPNASAVDRLIDFEAGLDKVVISRAAFGIASGVTPELLANAAPVASGPGGVLLYDNAGGGAGGLYWDADGQGGEGPVQIVRLSNAAPLSASDFLFVA